MPTIDLGKVKGDTGASMRSRHAWTANTAYVNNSEYIDFVTYGGNSYVCKSSHTSGSTFSETNWDLMAKKGDKGEKGNTGDVPAIQAGTVTSLDSTASPTVSSETIGNVTKFNFGIPKGDTSDIKTPTFDDSVGTYTTLATANSAAETASNAIKSKVNIFTTLSNMKKSFSAIVQGLKILGTNVGAINGITDSLTSTSSNVAASAAAIKALNDKTTELNGSLDNIFDATFIYELPVTINDISKIRTGGLYYIKSSDNILGLPEGTNGYLLVLVSYPNTRQCKQLFCRHGTMGTNDGNIYLRELLGDTIGSWWKFTGTKL